MEALLTEGQVALLVLVEQSPLDNWLHVTIAQNVRCIAILTEVRGRSSHCIGPFESVEFFEWALTVKFLKRVHVC